MHREYHPEDMRHLHAHAFEGGEAQAAHHHHHHHDEHRRLYVFTAVLGLLIGADLLLSAFAPYGWREPLGISLTLIAALLGGARIVYGALEALLAGRIGADIALAQACLAALVLGEWFVAAEVVFIAMVGEVLEAVTADRALRAIHRLFELTPRTALVRRDGVETEVPISQVVPGDLVLVRPGERVAVDGPVVTGRSAVDQATLTGESTPIDKGPGEPVFAGTVNQFGLLEVRAEKVGRDTTFGQVLRLVAEAQQRKAPLQRAADRYARLFLPIVETVAGLTLLLGYLLGWADVWERTVAVLVVACPCALVLATPAAIMASMAWLARHGVVIKGGAALEQLASCDTFAFDKTGTLTQGRPELATVVPLGGRSESDLLRLAATAESASQHPLAQAIANAAHERGISPAEAFDVLALPGAGVSAAWKGEDGQTRTVLVGNRRLLAEHGIATDGEVAEVLNDLDAKGETVLLVAVEGTVAGLLGVRDALRPEAHDVIHDLKHLKISEIAILTGDRPSAAKLVAKRTHIKTVEAELLPTDKARWIQDRQVAGRRVAMVGDGINDAPALATANVGIALGSVGADLAAEAGDLVILGEPLQVLPGLVSLSRATVAIIRQNIIGFAFGLNALAMGSAMLGILGPVPAAILHQAGSLLVLLNSMRLLAFGDWGESGPVRLLRSARGAVRRFDERFDPGLVTSWLWRRWRTLGAAGIGAALVLYATWGWTAIGADEVGLLRRFGQYRGVLPPGLHLRLPPPLERVTRLQPALLRSVEVGFGEIVPERRARAVSWESPHGRDDPGETDAQTLVLTGDGQYVELAATAQYRLDPRPERLRRFAFESADPERALRPLAEAAIRAEVSRHPLDDLLTDGRRLVEGEARVDLQRRIDAYGLGLIVTGIAFQDVHPPLEVVDAYRDISRAEKERKTRINEGLTYQADRLNARRARPPRPKTRPRPTARDAWRGPRARPMRFSFDRRPARRFPA